MKTFRGLGFGQFAFDQEPGFEISGNAEIDLPPVTIAQIPEVERTKTQVLPNLDRLEKMARDPRTDPSYNIFPPSF